MVMVGRREKRAVGSTDPAVAWRGMVGPTAHRCLHITAYWPLHSPHLSPPPGFSLPRPPLAPSLTRCTPLCLTCCTLSFLLSMPYILCGLSFLFRYTVLCTYVPSLCSPPLYACFPYLPTSAPTTRHLFLSRCRALTRSSPVSFAHICLLS